jgi:uncharacterized membrane protein (DUF4010 family)
MVEPLIYDYVIKIGLSLALGLMVGLEREWAHKEAGVRTFSLVCIGGTLFSFISQEMVIVGGVFVIGMSGFLSLLGLQQGTVRLTTITSLLITYGIGVIVGNGLYIPAILIGVITMTLLATKRELHEFAGEITEEEVRGMIKFAIVAFIVFPILPNYYIDPWNIINPRIIWLMVVLITGLSLMNYIFLRRYGERGVTYLAFFGGLVNSTAVVGEIVNRTKEIPKLKNISVSAVFVADIAMILRNLALVGIISFEIFKMVIGPMAMMMILAYVTTRVFRVTIESDFQVKIKSPVSLFNSLKFGVIFLAIILFGYFANLFFGNQGFIISGFISGLISSESATISALLLYLSASISGFTVAFTVLVASLASILVKFIFVATSRQKDFIKKVAIGDIIIAFGGIVALLVTGNLLHYI